MSKKKSRSLGLTLVSFGQSWVSLESQGKSRLENGLIGMNNNIYAYVCDFRRYVLLTYLEVFYIFLY